MIWPWDYLRVKARDAVTAGIREALAGSGIDLSGEQATTLGHFGPDTAAAGEASPQHPPQLPGTDPPGLPEATKRGPGRPRKFQEPPA